MKWTLFCVQDVLTSYLTPEAGCPDPVVSPGECRTSSWN